MHTYYELLDIPVHASKQQIRQAYIKKCKEFHPDLHDGADWAHERLQVINEAYHTLSDAFNRQQYDADLLQFDNDVSIAIVDDVSSDTSVDHVHIKKEDSSSKSKSKYVFRFLAGSVAVVLWSAVLIVKNFQATPDQAALEHQAIDEEQVRFQRFCERHPKLIRKSEYFLVMNTAPPIGFTFELERLLAKGDTATLRQKIAQLQATL